MRILHYTLGFSPYRSGGLTKYTHDLMVAQKELGHEVSALYPGGVSCFHRKCYVKNEKALYGINVFEMVNPLPVPLLYGVKEVDDLMDERNLNRISFDRMLDRLKPQVLHVHSLMGLPKLYLQMAHDRGIKILYTSHDYYGLCLKVNFIDNDGAFCQCVCSEKCRLCNQNAKSTLFLRIRNAKWIVPLKSFVRRWKK
jgi:hypothetical protein